MSSLEEILGPPEGRFFGDGFRRVIHAVTDVKWSRDEEGVELTADGAASYPADWSLDASGSPRETHLSSFDAVALIGVLLETAASDSRILDDLVGATVAQVRVRAPGRPVHTLDGIRLSARCARSQGQGWDVSAKVAGFAAALKLCPGPSSLGTVGPQIHLGTAPTPLDLGFCILDIQSVLQSEQSFTDRPRVLSCLEELAMFGRLCQAVVYLSKGVDRRSVPNLWVRKLTLDRSTRVPPSTIHAETCIVTARTVRVPDGAVADIRITSRTNYGAVVTASFGYRAS